MREQILPRPIHDRTPTNGPLTKNPTIAPLAPRSSTAAIVTPAEGMVDSADRGKESGRRKELWCEVARACFLSVQASLGCSPSFLRSPREFKQSSEISAESPETVDGARVREFNVRQQVVCKQQSDSPCLNIAQRARVVGGETGQNAHASNACAKVVSRHLTFEDNSYSRCLAHPSTDSCESLPLIM